MIIAFGSHAARAAEQADTDFAKRFFAGNVGKPKAYACFVRRYDAAAYGGASAAKGHRPESF